MDSHFDKNRPRRRYRTLREELVQRFHEEVGRGAEGSPPAEVYEPYFACPHCLYLLGPARPGTKWPLVCHECGQGVPENLNTVHLREEDGSFVTGGGVRFFKTRKEQYAWCDRRNARDAEARALRDASEALEREREKQERERRALDEGREMLAREQARVMDAVRVMGGERPGLSAEMQRVAVAAGLAALAALAVGVLLGIAFERGKQEPPPAAEVPE